MAVEKLGVHAILANVADTLGPDEQLDESDRQLLRLVCEGIEHGQASIIEILKKHQKSKEKMPQTPTNSPLNPRRRV